MPTAPKRERKFTYWSFSAWAGYEECPFRQAAKSIDKSYPGETSAAMDRGNDIHKLGEKFILDAIKRIPKELATFTEEFKALKTMKPRAEEMWEFDVNWRGYISDSYNSKTWLRVKMDAHYLEESKGLLRIIDYKTGKVYEEPGKMQLELYGLAGLLMYPAAQVVKASLWYLDQGKDADHEFTRADEPRLMALWTKRIKAMFADRKFAPRPGRHCGWCLLSKAKGGPCKY